MLNLISKSMSERKPFKIQIKPVEEIGYIPEECDKKKLSKADEIY